MYRQKSLMLFFGLLLAGADVISFDGHGIISYRFRSKMKIVGDVISLKFRTMAGNGVLLHGEGQQGDYISLELRRARLQLSINLGGVTCCLLFSDRWFNSSTIRCNLLLSKMAQSMFDFLTVLQAVTSTVLFRVTLL